MTKGQRKSTALATVPATILAVLDEICSAMTQARPSITTLFRCFFLWLLQYTLEASLLLCARLQTCWLRVERICTVLTPAGLIRALPGKEDTLELQAGNTAAGHSIQVVLSWMTEMLNCKECKQMIGLSPILAAWHGNLARHAAC